MSSSLHLLGESDEFSIVTISRRERWGDCVSWLRGRVNSSLQLLGEGEKFSVVTVRRYKRRGGHPPLHVLNDFHEFCIVFIRCYERLRKWLGDFKEWYRYCFTNLPKDYIDVRLRTTNNFEVVENRRTA